MEDINIKEMDDEGQNIDKIYKIPDNVKDAVLKYYMDKSEYQNKVEQIKKKIIQNETVKNTIPKCIFCDRHVGTVFTTEIAKNGSKILLAKCGDHLEPCNQKIEISTGKMTTFMIKIRGYDTTLDQLKKQIILFKNDILFGYISETNIKDKYEDLKFKIDKYSLELQIIKELYSKNIDTYENYEQLCKLEQQSFHYIEEIKTRIHNYKHDTTDFAEKADDIYELIDLYTKTFMPLIKNIMDLKYSISRVDYEVDDNGFRLIQIPQKNDISENEYSEIPVEVIQGQTIEDIHLKKQKRQKNPMFNKTLKMPKTLRKVKTKKIAVPLYNEDEDEDIAQIPKTLKKVKTKKVPTYKEDELEEFIPEVKGVTDVKGITAVKGTTAVKGMMDEEDDDARLLKEFIPEINEEEIESIDEESMMKHDIKQKVMHSSINEDLYKLVSNIPTMVETQHMYNDRIVFRCSSGSLPAAPGEGEGEEIPEADESKFKELSRIKDWRKKLADFWTGSGDWSSEFILDGKRWRSVEHYYQASKFKHDHPEFYEKFSLDYTGVSVEGHPELVIAQKPSLAKHAGTDGIYEGIRIRPENIEFDDDFFNKEDGSHYRQNYEKFLAQKAKFTTNHKMRTLLLATKDAKLTHSYKAVETGMRIIEPYYYLIYIRHLLQSEHK